MRWFVLIVSLMLCSSKPETAGETEPAQTPRPRFELMVLGNVQDGGSPHIACEKDCCSKLYKNATAPRMVSCLGLIDFRNQNQWLFDASPDLPAQLHDLCQVSGLMERGGLRGIFLTHAHIGHYTGLMYLGREALGVSGKLVYTLPRMHKFLEDNGPWSQLVKLGNIKLHELKPGEPYEELEALSITPLLVPHRDEYSETVGFIIKSPGKKAIYLPDIDKWEKWDRKIVDVIREVDYAFLDGTFYSAAEINNRDISEIPHPFVSESMALFKDLPANERNKVYFIHLNHTNPLLDSTSAASMEVRQAGMHVARQGMRFGM